MNYFHVERHAGAIETPVAEENRADVWLGSEGVRSVLGDGNGAISATIDVDESAPEEKGAEFLITDVRVFAPANCNHQRSTQARAKRYLLVNSSLASKPGIRFFLRRQEPFAGSTRGGDTVARSSRDGALEPMVD